VVHGALDQRSHGSTAVHGGTRIRADPLGAIARLDKGRDAISRSGNRPDGHSGAPGDAAAPDATAPDAPATPEGGALIDATVGSDGGVDTGAPADGGGEPGEFVFMATYLTGLRVFSIDPRTGAPDEIDGSPVGVDAGVSGIALDPTKTFAYVVDTNAGAIDGYRIAPDSGALTHLSAFPVVIGGVPLTITVDPLGRFVYVGESKSLFVFSIEPTSGALTAVAHSPFDAGGTVAFVAADLSGHFVYASQAGPAGILAFSVDSAGSQLFDYEVTTVRVESDPDEQPEPAWTAWLVAWSSRLHNRWVNRRHGKAQVRAIELVVPGLTERLRPGVTLRLRHQIHAGPGIATGLVTEVTLTEGPSLVATWTPAAPVRSPW